MPTTIVGSGDRLITVGGRASWLKRPSVPLAQWGGGGMVRLAGGSKTVSYGQLYDQQPWVKVCVDAIARQISTLPLKVYTLGSQNEKVRITDGRLVDLLKNPWPRARAVHLQQKIAYPALIHGNALFAKIRGDGNAGPPIRLRPLDWRYIEPEETSGEILFWKTSQYGDELRLDPEQAVHIYWESPGSCVGTSPLLPLGVTLRLEDAAQRHQASSFENATRGSIAVNLDKDARYDDETRSAIRESIQATHGGPDNAFKPMVFGGGASVEVLSHTAVEAELIEQRKLNREEVAAVYNVPPPMVGILDNATYSNISEQHKMLYMTVLRPWFELIQQTLEAHLLDGEIAFDGQALEFDLSEVLKGDAKDRAEAFKTFLESGVYTINELRKMENLPVVAHTLADSPLIPANNMQPLDNVADSDPTGIAPTLASHVSRAAHRHFTHLGAGNGSFDSDRFKRELSEDLESKLGEGSEPFADVWTAAIEQGVTDADGDRESLEQFFTALGA